MRIAYDNALKYATLTATSENANYPVENLYHAWKRKLFKATDTSTVITAVLDSIQTITCVALSYHNLTSCTVEFYDTSDTLLDTWTMDTDNTTDAQYGTVEQVKTVIITCSGITPLQIGTLFVGDSVYSEMQPDTDFPLTTSDSPTESSDRQIAGRKGSVFRGASIEIRSNHETREAIEDVYLVCGQITPFFLDMWDASHDKVLPVYGVFTSDLSVTHGQDYDTISFDFKEAN